MQGVSRAPMKALATLLFLLGGWAAAEDKPNLIVFLVDDMGW